MSGGNNNANAEPTNRLYVSGIPFSFKEDKMKEIFGKYGEVSDVFLPIFSDTGKPKGFGFVTLDSNEAAANALELNGKSFDGKPLKVELSQPKSRDNNNRNFGNKGRFGGDNSGGGNKFGGDRSGGGGGKFGGERRERNTGPLSDTPPDNCVTLFVGNLSYQVQDDDIYEFFKDLEITQIRYVEDRQTGQFKGSAFIDFANTDTLVKAGKLNGQQLKGRPVNLDYARPKNNNR